MPLLEVDGLSVTIGTGARRAFLVRDVTFAVDRGEMIGIVGESGCGKSTTALAVAALLPDVARCTGRVRFEDRDLLSLSERELCALRGDRFSMIFQEPMTALNPLKRVGRQIGEALELHEGMSRSAARAQAIRLLDRVGIAQAHGKIDAYPHQLSGGQRQRVVIAIALACRPDLIIADEPTTALDTTVQRQILDLLVELVDETQIALILITHNLAVVSEVADKVLVMYAGSVVESGPAEGILAAPQHPYTRGLLRALPRPDDASGARLRPIAGTVPSIDQRVRGCRFADRCPDAIGECLLSPPTPRVVGSAHEAACWRVPFGGGPGASA